MFVDTHLHLSKEDYDNIDEVINNAMNNNVGLLFISCCDMKNLDESLEIINRYKNVYLEIGLHPDQCLNYKDEDLDKIEYLINNEAKVVAVGEIGLDYHYGREDRIKQIELFKKQLEIAQKYKLPVVIHSRDSVEDTINILSKYNLNGIIHCFSGSLEIAKRYIKMGYKLGIGGVLTFKNSKLYSVIENVDVSSIVLETDSPYLAPEPFRGKKNEPKYIPFIAKRISEIKNIDVKDIADITTNTAKTIFKIK